MRAFFARLVNDESGATAVEYGLIAALIAVAAVTIMGTSGTNLSSTFNKVAGKL
jgi:pilus assembly protein Flp/PilA